MRARRHGPGLLLAAALLVGACGDGGDTKSDTTASHAEEDEHAHHGSDEEADFPLADADVTVKVAMKDFSFGGVPPTVKGRKVLFEVTNNGPSEHEFVVFGRGTDEAVRGVRPFAKGKTQMLALELEPGSYTARCLVELGDQTHAELGMQTDFTVG